MSKRGRPRGAQSGPRPNHYWVAWGTPNGTHEHAYTTESAARDKALTELENMRRFALRHSQVMAEQLAVNKQLVRDAAYSGANREAPREWVATDDVSAVTFVVRLWKET
jgi:hypothetical protein